MGFGTGWLAKFNFYVEVFDCFRFCPSGKWNFAPPSLVLE